jgi:hypothetical protein
MASQGLPDLLAVALALSRTPQDERRNPGTHPSDEPRSLVSERHCASARTFDNLMEQSGKILGGNFALLIALELVGPVRFREHKTSPGCLSRGPLIQKGYS